MRIIAFVVLLICAVSVASAQYEGRSGSDGVYATATSAIKATPKFLVMTVQIEGRSSELPQAAEELKRRVDIAKQRLVELEAIAESIELGKPTLSGTSSQEEAQRMQMMMQQYGGGERGKQMLEQTRSVSILQTLTARWPLPGDDDLQRIVETKALTEKIRKRDVASSADKQPVSAAQEELAVEMEAMMSEYSYGEETTKVGDPTFTFLAIVPAADYRDAIASAFRDTKAKIKTIGDVTKTQLEFTRPVSSSFDVLSAEPDYYGNSVGEEPKADPDTGDYEVMADNPNEVTCEVTVTAVGKYRS